ncbi:unnamed protein product, partial [marine sediment metagenome]
MSFPNVIYKGFGAEKETGSAKIGSLPLGQIMKLPGGNEYRHTKASSAASLGAGVIVSSPLAVSGHGTVSGSGLLASATTTYNPVGATTVRLLAKSAAFTTDQYADGTLNVQGPALSGYIGHTYRIKSNKSAASVSELELELEKNDGLQVAFSAGATFCSLLKNQYQDTVVCATALYPVGITPVAVSAGHYFWAQTDGIASVVQGATVCVQNSGVM